MKTSYTFTKNGHSYSIKANNEVDAQAALERIYHMSLKGATWTEYYKLRAVSTGRAY